MRVQVSEGVTMPCDSIDDRMMFDGKLGSGETFTVDAAYVADKVAPLAQKGDLSRFIL